MQALIKRKGRLDIRPHDILHAVDGGKAPEIIDCGAAGSYTAPQRFDGDIEPDLIAILEGLKAAGCFTEIIGWRTRVFVPNDERREEIVARVLARYGRTAGERDAA